MEKKRITVFKIFVLAVLLVIPAGFMFSANHVNAASIKKTTKKAKKLYKKKIESISYENGGCSYKITNIVGNAVPELLVSYIKGGERHGSFVIYAYKRGKLKKLLSTENDNLKVYLYKKTKTLMVYDSYHDYHVYQYYRYSSGKYRLKVSDCYNDVVDPFHWYENSKGNRISKSKYKKTVKKLKKGKKKNLHYENWTYVDYDECEEDDE